MARPIRTIRYTSRFEKRYRKLPVEVQKAVELKESAFRLDAFHPLLKTHKLHGPLEGSWAFKLDYDLRIVFRFPKNDSAIFLSIGSHDAVY